MKLTWHLAQKDLRRFWLPIALFATVIAAKLLAGWVLLRSTGDSDFSALVSILKYANAATVLEWLVAYFLVAAVVQADPLIGTTAFWMTKPISGLRLLSAKMVVLVIAFAVLPLVITLPWWMVCGFNLADIVLAGLETILWQALTVAIALPVAALTATIARFLIVSLVGVIAVAIAAVYYGRGYSSPLVNDFFSEGFAATRGIVLVGIFLLGATVLIVHQYRTRRFRRSLVIVGISVILFWGAHWGWRWDWSVPKQGESEASPIQVSVHAAELHLRSGLPAGRALAPQLDVSAIVDGIPPGHVLRQTSVGQELRSADGPNLHLRTSWKYVSDQDPELWSMLHLPPPPHELASLNPLAPDPGGRRASLRSATIPARGTRVFTTSARLPRASAVDAPQHDFSLTLTTRFELLRVTVGEKVPLREGAALDADRSRLRITSVETSNGTVFVTAVEQLPARAWNEFARSNSRQQVPFSDHLDDTFLFIDHVRGSLPSEWSSSRLRIAGVGFNLRTVKFQPHLGPGQTPATPADYSVVKLHYEPVEIIQRTVHVPKLSIQRDLPLPAQIE